MFTKSDYLKTDVWVGNDYLVQPETAVKRCSCCGILQYTVEFPNVPELIDGKLPVCITCFKSRKRADMVNGIINRIDETRACKKCGEERRLESFMSYRKKYNDFDGKCSSCRPSSPEWWKSIESDD